MTWAKFAVLYAGALLGAIAIAPYSLRLIEQSGRSISPSRFLLLSFAQNAVLFCVVIALGLLAARAVGLGAPYVEAALGGPAPDHSPSEMLVRSLGLGVAGGALLLTIDLVLIPHLPATLAITESITPLLVGRTLVLNVPIGLICGWLLCRFGIEAAIAAHFTADVIYHVGGTLLLRANDQFGVLPWFPSAGP